MLILRLLADGAIIQAWNAIAKGELLILLNVVGIYFPQSKEAPMAMSPPRNGSPPIPKTKNSSPSKE
jgi:hypothetical protein